MNEHTPSSDSTPPHTSESDLKHRDASGGSIHGHSADGPFTSLAQFLKQAPIAAAVLRGPQHVVESVSPAMAEILGQSVALLIDKPLLSTIPKMGGRDFRETLNSAIRSGESAHESRVLVNHHRTGQPDEYYDFAFDALRNDQGEIIGCTIVATDVTELVAAEKKLARQQQQVEDLFEQAPIPVLVYRGTDYMIEGMNDTACRLLGRTKEESLNTPLFHLLPELKGQGLEELLEKVMTTGEPHVAREYAATFNRFEQEETTYWDFIYYPNRDELRDVVGVTVIGNEITEQVKARQRAESQQRRLLKLFEQFPMGIAIFRGPNHAVELVNSKAGQIWGVNGDRLLNQPLLNVLPEIQEQGLSTLLDQVFHTGEPFFANEHPISFNRKNKSGTSYFTFMYQPWRDEHDEIVGVIAVALDVSQRVAARREEYRLKALLDNSKGFVGLLNAKGKGIYLNQAGRDMVGVNAEASISDFNFVEFLEEEEQHYFTQTILPILLDKSKGWWKGEYRFRNLITHKTVPAISSYFAVRDPGTDELLGLGAIITDIAEQRQRTDELQRYREQLSLSNQQLSAINEKMAATNEVLNSSNEELTEMNERLTRVNTDLDNFVYTASHDLKAPITNIQGLINLLRSDSSFSSQVTERTQRTLGMMEASVGRFMRTIRDLSDIARLQRQGDEPEELVDLPDLVDRICLDIASDIETTNAQIHLDVSDCGAVRFSPKNLRSILYNLLSNAIKYRDPNRNPEIRIQCKMVGKYKVLTVADNGLGMDLSENTQLFGLFRRLHSHVEGTGIGLYIVKKIIENAGGKIDVESEVGVGTTFTVYFRR